jgi:hypothetical protein
LVKTLNLQAYSLAGGGVIRFPWLNFLPSLLFDHVLLAQTTFLRNRGGSLRAEGKINRQLSLYAEFKNIYQDYSRTAQVPTAPERTGIQADGALGADYLLTPTMRLGFSYTHSLKHAQKRYNAFSRDALGLSHAWLLGKGTFFITGLNLNYDQYDQPDTVISAKFRKDTVLRASGTFGASLGPLHQSMKDLVWTFTYEYYQALSSITNYAYTNNKVATLLTYRWEIGL